MSFLDRFFRPKQGTDAVEKRPTVRFGRFSDSYKTPVQYEAWAEALRLFEDQKYLESYQAFFKYLRDDSADNVRWLEVGNGIEFEILQGSKKLAGFSDARHFKAEARIAKASSLSVAFMRRLVESNYSLDYSRYALDDSDHLVIKFDTSALDGSPYKLYYALKEVCTNADKLDDLLIDEFGKMLSPIDNGSVISIPLEEQTIKYDYIVTEIQRCFEHLDNSAFDAGQYPGAGSYQLLNLAYKIDHLILPEGFLMDTIERVHRSYFATDGKTATQKNTQIRKEFDKIATRDKSMVISELYQTTSTFGILQPQNHDTLSNLIEGEISGMDWYEQNKHPQVALAVTGFIVGNALFSYALPQPDRAFLHLYYHIFENAYFKAHGFKPHYYDAESQTFDSKSIKQGIREIVQKHSAKYPYLSPEYGSLDFSSPTHFARSYLRMLQMLDMKTAD
jgi:hypothetical protein